VLTGLVPGITGISQARTKGDSTGCSDWSNTSSIMATCGNEVCGKRVAGDVNARCTAFHPHFCFPTGPDCPPAGSILFQFAKNGWLAAAKSDTPSAFNNFIGATT
jgi:hypothetical protein